MTTSRTHFTRYDEWIAEWNILSLPEALVLSRIRQWGSQGCFESYARIGKKLKLNRRTVIRAVMTLHDKDIIIIKHISSQKRLLTFNYHNTNLPIFDKKLVSESHQLKKGSATQTPSSVRESPEVVSGSHPIISNKTIDKTKEKINLTADMMKQETKLSLSAKEKRRKELLKQLEGFE